MNVDTEEYIAIGKTTEIIFAKTGEGRDPMMQSPAEISPEQLLGLNITSIKKKI